MGCNEIQPFLKAWLDGETDDSRGATIEAHVERCPRCREQADDFRRLSALIRAAEVSAVPTPDVGKIRGRVAQIKVEDEKTLRFLKRIAAAAAVLLVVTLPLGAWSVLTDSEDARVAIPAEREAGREGPAGPDAVDADVDTDAALAAFFSSLEAGGGVAEGDF